MAESRISKLIVNKLTIDAGGRLPIVEYTLCDDGGNALGHNNVEFQPSPDVVYAIQELAKLVENQLSNFVFGGSNDATDGPTTDGADDRLSRNPFDDPNR